ncbi:MAG: hypothetical protein WBI06_14640 [Paludibacter sp.]
MKKIIVLIIICGLSVISSCASYRKTQFMASSINIGMDKEIVIKKFGYPFKTDSYEKDKNLYEIFYYKEPVDVSSYTYIITTILTFKNNFLIDIKQEEEYAPSHPRPIMNS